METVLASASPRRRELLEMLGVKDLKIIPACGEESMAAGEGPEEAVCRLSREKALEVAGRVEGSPLVIAADTVVYANGRILGKPGDEAEARKMLSGLSGREHAVFTGVTLVQGETVITEYERTLVRFRQMTDAEISAYVATGEPMDKAGAYGIQGMGSLFVAGITGDFFNVMGLPLCRLALMLKKLEVSLL